MIAELGHSALMRIDPEKAHAMALRFMRFGIGAPGKYKSSRMTNLFGVNLDNPLGIAAGFDKYAKVDNSRDYGFAWIEKGSFTARGGEGNPGKRLFRLPNGGLLNRMGLNCISAYEAADILEDKDQTSFAVSIAKTHDPQIMGDGAIRDFQNSYHALRHLGIYTALNLSCPNTTEGKTFEEPEPLRDLFCALDELDDVCLESRKSRVVKLSPNLTRDKRAKIVEVVDSRVEGYEVVNTLPSTHPLFGKGGESGPDLYPLALESVRHLREMTKKPIIAVGGIRSGWNMYNLRKAGADVFLVYTGFVYGSPNSGPKFAHRTLSEFDSLLEKAA